MEQRKKLSYMRNLLQNDIELIDSYLHDMTYDAQAAWIHIIKMAEKGKEAQLKELENQELGEP